MTGLLVTYSDFQASATVSPQTQSVSARQRSHRPKQSHSARQSVVGANVNQPFAQYLPNHSVYQSGGTDKTEQYFTASVLTSSLGGFGSFGRNVRRAPSQSRLDFGLSKVTKLTERVLQVGAKLRF